VWCLRAEKVESTMASLAIAQPRATFIDDDELASIETETQMMKASLSAHFGIPIDAVDVVMTDDAGNLRMRYATIFLTERDVRRITGQQHGG
jgi:hypothetical protein